ncbi:hypothetical protein K493DRAFT_307436 [Basidiobolus meristosporus CBS 931.73]|uniref:Uncharacterized protein n=1 Tax=Basidiobolus meristosporus CBS 931.73 TaxID=1314790 RepID=A0A1Y1XFI5_9FUNG|nr:hypothetical protein K493DRAFT_307436 [Basidiobolus meristosporus CBS 931.73]|eukprot:ORX84519.1 hypothetical protein K493DRAFT_307436 [Basidiobolus meristosporus CBS 931.73]
MQVILVYSTLEDAITLTAEGVFFYGTAPVTSLKHHTLYLNMLLKLFLIHTLIFNTFATIQIVTPSPGAQSYFPSYDFYQDAPKYYNLTLVLLPAKLSEGCHLSSDPINNTLVTDRNIDGSSILVDWSEAMVKGCYEFAQLVSYSQALQQLGYPPLKAAIFTSSLESNFAFGNLYHESYGYYFTNKPDNIQLSLIAKDHGILFKAMLRTSINPTVQVLEVDLYQSILFLGYIVYRLYQFYCIHRMILDIRVGIYVASFVYLLIGICVDTNSVNGALGQVSIYISWLVGYLAYGGLLLTCFLKNLTTMELSERSRLGMRKLTILAFATIPGWILLMLTAILLASTLTATVVGYVANMIAYKLAGFQLFGVFFLILTLGEASDPNPSQKPETDGIASKYPSHPLPA